MKHKQYVILSAVAAAAVLGAVSCSNLFTTSLAGNLKRNMSAQFAKASVSELAKMAGDPAVIKDIDTGRALIDALSEKNQEDLRHLSEQEKQNILDVAVSSSLPISSLTDTINNLKNQSGSVDADKVVSEVLGSLPSVKTEAVNTLLNDSSTLETAPVETLVTASLVLVTQAAKDDPLITGGNRDGTMQAIQDALSKNNEADKKSAIDQLKADGKISQDTVTALQTVVNVAESLNSNRKDDLSDLSIGGINLGDYIGIKSK